MVYINRYNLKEGKNAEFHRWILENRDVLTEGSPEGWRYLGTLFTVRGLGQFDAEMRSERDSATNPSNGCSGNGSASSTVRSKPP
jgi:hypothetical protein